MKSHFRLLLVLLLIIAAVVSFWLMRADLASHGDSNAPQTTGEPPISVAREDVAAAPSKLVNNTSSVPVPEQLPASLAGTSVPDGWARTDRLGNLIPTPQLRQLFEYFLSALGEESLPQLVARIQRALSVLDEPARAQALVTLGAYLDYKLAGRRHGQRFFCRR